MKAIEFSDEICNVDVYFQIVSLDKQYYASASTQRKMPNICCSVPVNQQGMPPVSKLIVGGDSDAAASLAQRLVHKTGKSMLVSLDLPKGVEELKIAVQKRIEEELVKLEKE